MATFRTPDNNGECCDCAEDGDDPCAPCVCEGCEHTEVWSDSAASFGFAAELLCRGVSASGTGKPESWENGIVGENGEEGRTYSPWGFKAYDQSKTYYKNVTTTYSCNGTRTYDNGGGCTATQTFTGSGGGNLRYVNSTQYYPTIGSVNAGGSVNTQESCPNPEYEQIGVRSWLNGFGSNVIQGVVYGTITVKTSNNRYPELNGQYQSSISYGGDIILVADQPRYPTQDYHTPFIISKTETVLTRGGPGFLGLGYGTDASPGFTNYRSTLSNKIKNFPPETASELKKRIIDSLGEQAYPNNWTGGCVASSNAISNTYNNIEYLSFSATRIQYKFVVKSFILGGYLTIKWVERFIPEGNPDGFIDTPKTFTFPANASVGTESAIFTVDPPGSDGVIRVTEVSSCVSGFPDYTYFLELPICATSWTYFFTPGGVPTEVSVNDDVLLYCGNEDDLVDAHGTTSVDYSGIYLNITIRPQCDGKCGPAPGWSGYIYCNSD